jgi:hypothetical protein
MKVTCNKPRNNFTVGKEYEATPSMYSGCFIVVNDLGDKEVVRLKPIKGVDVVA